MNSTASLEMGHNTACATMRAPSAARSERDLGCNSSSHRVIRGTSGGGRPCATRSGWKAAYISTSGPRSRELSSRTTSGRAPCIPISTALKTSSGAPAMVSLAPAAATLLPSNFDADRGARPASRRHVVDRYPPSCVGLKLDAWAHPLRSCVKSLRPRTPVPFAPPDRPRPATSHAPAPDRCKLLATPRTGDRTWKTQVLSSALATVN